MLNGIDNVSSIDCFSRILIDTFLSFFNIKMITPINKINSSNPKFAFNKFELKMSFVICTIGCLNFISSPERKNNDIPLPIPYLLI